MQPIYDPEWGLFFVLKTLVFFAVVLLYINLLPVCFNGAYY